jgi:predicted nucleotidyltransferase/HEPN domain-containing protein
MPAAEELMGLAEALKEALLEAYEIEAILLFGSLGRGEADEFSDVDLLLVVETDRDTAVLGKEMAGYLGGLTQDKPMIGHIIVKTPQEFCRQKDIPGTLVFSAEKDGRTLFDKKAWRRLHMPIDSYEKRKREVIDREYLRSAFDFLSRARSCLQSGSFYGCRDFARFAAARAIKGLFVKHDIHPPRGTDLADLLSKAKELEPDLVKCNEFIKELNQYCPGEADAAESRRSARMIDRTVMLVREIVPIYGTDRQSHVSEIPWHNLFPPLPENKKLGGREPLHYKKTDQSFNNRPAIRSKSRQKTSDKRVPRRG